MPTFRAGEEGSSMRRHLCRPHVVFALTAAAISIIGVQLRGQEPEAATRQVAGCNYVAKEFNQCALEKAKTFNVPRTSDGKPDLQGLWTAPGNAYDFEGRRYDTVPFKPERSLIID